LATFPYTGFLDGSSYPQIPLGTTTVTVTSSASLSTALANATAGQRILLGSGTYSGAFTLTGKVGTASAGITIEAATQGGAVFASGSTFVTKDCQQVTLKGLVFAFEPSSGNVIAFRGTSRNCRVTRCTFGPTTISSSPGTTKAAFVFGSDDAEHIRVDHCEIRNKANPGNAILFDGNFTTFQACKHIRIDHNYIHDIKPEVDNEKEPIRLGVSSMSKTMSYSVIERNRFEACIAEPEVTSVKAGGVRVSGNVYANCIGGPVYRHGTGGVTSDNYIVDTGSTPPGGGGGGGGGTPAGQTLGVGGIATPAGAILATSDRPGVQLDITTSGTATQRRVYDGQGHKIGTIKIRASFVTVQNYRIEARQQYGVDCKLGTANHDVIIQNNDIKDLRPTGDGDLNAMTISGNDIKILYNTAIDFVGQESSGSHTDAIQTWNDGPGDESTSNLYVIGNWFEGPPAETDTPTYQHIHQAVIGEGKDSTDGGGGGTGVSQNWFIADNYWTADCKFDDIDNVTYTRNTFAGVDKRAVVVTSLSSGFKYYSDNKITGTTTIEIGATVIPGPGPATPTFN